MSRKRSRHSITQLTHQRGGDVVDVERGLWRLLGDAGVEEHLQQDVAEFFTQRLGVATADGVQQLVGLLEQEPAQRVVGLLALPRPGGTQFVHHRDGVDETFAARRVRRRDQPGSGG